MTFRTTLEINKTHLSHNLAYFRSILKKDTKVMVMVKAFGYGLGNPEISRILESEGVDYLGVAFIPEGVALRKSGINLPIMVMNPHEALFEDLLNFELEPELFNLKILSELEKFARQHSKRFKIHIKLESGMNRLGFEAEHYDDLIKILKNNDYLEVKGIMSHLSAAEVEDEEEFTLSQIRKFDKACTYISSQIHSSPIRHILNTAGAIKYPEYQFELVRLGIGIYGVNTTSKNVPLKPVATLKTYVSQIKTLNTGDTVGYGRAGVITKDNTRIATLAMGYADGFYRSMGNGNCMVCINGQWAPTFGIVCMDMFMVDITGLSVEEGDEVEIFGENQSVEKVAEAANTIPYEVFTSIGERVQRVLL